MKYLKILGLAAIAAAALMAFAGSASATTLTSPANTQYSGSISSVNEKTVILHPPFGDIECKKSTVEGSITNAGGAESTVSGNIKEEGSVHGLTFSECNATVTVIKSGSLEVHTQEANNNHNGTVTSTGTEVTVELLGTHCIFATSGTDIGTLTGSSNTGSNATFDISATIPRTEGRSGAFCGTSAQWTGSYKVTSPTFLDVD